MEDKIKIGNIVRIKDLSDCPESDILPAAYGLTGRISRIANGWSALFEQEKPYEIFLTKKPENWKSQYISLKRDEFIKLRD